jgi:hypothetical protein
MTTVRATLRRERAISIGQLTASWGDPVRLPLTQRG